MSLKVLARPNAHPIPLHHAGDDDDLDDDDHEVVTPPPVNVQVSIGAPVMSSYNPFLMTGGQLPMTMMGAVKKWRKWP